VEAASSGEESKLPAIDVLTASIFFLLHTGGILYLNMLMLQAASWWAFWSVAACSWLIVGLYVYSIMAPQFMRERDFY